MTGTILACVAAAFLLGLLIGQRRARGGAALFLIERDGQLHEAPPEHAAFCLEPARRRPSMPAPWRVGWPNVPRR